MTDEQNPPLPDYGPRDGEHEHTEESWPTKDGGEVKETTDVETSSSSTSSSTDSSSSDS